MPYHVSITRTKPNTKDETMSPKTRQRQLREAVQATGNDDAAAIRSSYYDAACGLMELQRVLERHAGNTALADELKAVRNAVEAMSPSLLGAVV